VSSGLGIEPSAGEKNRVRRTGRCHRRGFRWPLSCFRPVCSRRQVYLIRRQQWFHMSPDRTRRLPYSRPTDGARTSAVAYPL